MNDGESLLKYGKNFVIHMQGWTNTGTGKTVIIQKF